MTVLLLLCSRRLHIVVGRMCAVASFVKPLLTAALTLLTASVAYICKAIALSNRKSSHKGLLEAVADH